MDQFPTEEEEFELRYQEELDLIDDIDDPTIVNIDPQPGPSKRFVNDTRSSVLQSPQLSQISYGENSGAQVNRCLFGTPGGGAKRISSTPLIDKHTEPVSALTEIQNIGLSRKRRLEDLFGDIRDIEDEIYIDREAKKLKSEEERDLEMIEKILEARKKARENNNPLKKDQLEKLNALHEFKMRNLSYSLPNWPFIPLTRSDDERIYVRFHSEDFEDRQLELINVFSKGYSGLLGDQKQAIWDVAHELTAKRLTAQINQSQPAIDDVMEVDAEPIDGNLWVEKYKPRKYIDLLSDESTNRSLLYWLKMWDKVVFGREFKAKIIPTGKLNTFNKKTGRFETTGGWANRKNKALNTDFDEHGRPIQKVALLCGPPGLGKTTLAHTIARHAGYNIRELNASDDRSPDAFKLALENGTQMTSVLNQDKRPNCIILDEIDGAPNPSIEFLIKFVTDNVVTKSKKGTKSQKFILKRPVICICNDLYVPALRQLRQIAFVVNFPPIESSRLSDRLLEISRKEHLNTDSGALLALAEKSGNDVRSCISMMQFYNAKKKKLSLLDVLNTNLGQKDRHRGLFDVWSAIFQIQRPRKQLSNSEVNDGLNSQVVTMTDTSTSTRAKQILEIVHSGGDYERLLQGVHENYLTQKMPDPNLHGIVEATQWFCFSDEIQKLISHQQNYSVYPYLQFGFVVWHLLFAGLAWPKIKFPSKSYEINQKLTTTKLIFQALRRGITSGAIGIGQGKVILLETVPLLKRILSPNLRSVSLQLLTPKERYDLKHTVEVMADLGLVFNQLKTVDGTYNYQLEPDLDLLCNFQGYQGITLSYFGRQLIAREVEMEQVRRATPKISEASKANKAKQQQQQNKKQLPNHLQTLKPKIQRSSNMKETVSKDFFGRMTTKQAALTVQEGGTDVIVKSPIWYRYKEGFNNAVRKDVLMSDIL